jgi:hypothetical protein
MPKTPYLLTPTKSDHTAGERPIGPDRSVSGRRQSNAWPPLPMKKVLSAGGAGYNLCPFANLDFAVGIIVGSELAYEMREALTDGCVGAGLNLESSNRICSP